MHYVLANSRFFCFPYLPLFSMLTALSLVHLLLEVLNCKFVREGLSPIAKVLSAGRLSCFCLFFVMLCILLWCMLFENKSIFKYAHGWSCRVGIASHPLRTYLDYVGYLYQRMEPLPEQERFEVARLLSMLLLFLNFLGDHFG